MKTCMFSVFAVLALLVSQPETSPLLPVEVNQFLGSIQADMPESDLRSLVIEAFPDAEIRLGRWSGGTGYLEICVTAEYIISIAEYDDRKEANRSRHVHPNLTFIIEDRNRDGAFQLSARGSKKPQLPMQHE